MVVIARTTFINNVRTQRMEVIVLITVVLVLIPKIVEHV